MMERRLEGIGMTSRRTRDRLINRLKESGIADDRVLEAITGVPRHLFVDEALGTRAYEDTALPIGHGQTISQPYMVAKMTELLIADGMPDRILEIGTGSGYQAAVLDALGIEVYSVERIEPLLRQARRRLYDLGYRRCHLKLATDSVGWPEKGPFIAIIVTAGAEEMPQALYDQLALDGRMVVPVGRGGEQELILIRKTASGPEQQTLERVRFVPLIVKES